MGKWHGGVRRTAADYGFEGPDLAGWHNPVDHPDYLAYLEEHGLPPYRITDHVRGTTPNGSPGNLLAARLHQPVEATFEYYLATRTIEMMRRWAEDGVGEPGTERERGMERERGAERELPPERPERTGRSSWPPTSSDRTCPTSSRTPTTTCTTPRWSSCRRR